MPAELVTIPNIKLIETGTWNASTGEVTFTSAMLYAAVAAYESDPAVKAPRMRFGHTDPSVSMYESAGGFDSQPCVGKFTNLRVEDEGNSLVGDLVGVPAWLAEILPIAYPNRSVEAFHNVTTATGKKHDLVVTSVALLGDELPAVETLEDLELLFTEGSEEWINALTGGEMIAASKEVVMPKRVSASLDVNDVRTAFYDQIATEESGRYWWWLHQVYLDPSVVIAEDDNGEFWLIPYDRTSADMGEPVQVYIQWVETDSGKVAAAKSTKVGLPSEFGEAETVYASAAESRPAERQQQFESNQTKEENGMNPDLIKRLRELHGLSADQLPDDATEEQVMEALASASAPEKDDEVETEANAEVETEVEAKVETGEPVLAKNGVTVEKSAWDETQAFVKAAKEKERKSFISAAIKDRKIPPSREAHYLSLMEKDPQGTREFINKLEKDAVPGPEVGSSEDRVSTGRRAEGTGLLTELQPTEA